MALMIMGSSGGCCGRSGSALPDITMHAGAGARGASSVSATNIELGRAATAAPGVRRRGRTRVHSGGVHRFCGAVGSFNHLLAQKKRENGPTLLKR